MKRRTFLATGLSLSMAPSNLLSKTNAGESQLISSLRREPAAMEQSDHRFLRDLQQRCYQFFVDAAHPSTGFISDRGATDGSWFSDHASSAACGFGLAAHSVAAQSEWIPRELAADRTRHLLHSLVMLANHKKGFVYHFFDAASGKRSRGAEASSIDTALLIIGAMTAATTFSDDLEIVQLADELYRRVDWMWMLGANDWMHMGWTPESGMIPHQWDSFSELIVLVLLAIGAPNSPIPPRCWQAWRRSPVLQHDGEDFISYPPLFVHQYPMAFFDFRKVRSASGRSYWDNSVRAHHAQIAFMTELGNRYPAQMRHYGNDLWGLTSSDSAGGYRDWGGPYENGRCEPDRDIDGTIVPSAAAGGLAIVPQQALHTLRYQKQHFGDKIFSRYGFVNAYNPATQWVGRDVIGIDTGITLVMAENLLTGGVWDAFMRHPAANRAFSLAGFV
ncbi:glucoamylase family protein [Novipirellula sp.]|uniref:glucoamylase family protein n=1 Tax=Novipirellula sp. TaxID=2795430 RepID=UPI00356553C6